VLFSLTLMNQQRNLLTENNMVRIEAFVDNEWIVKSWHKNEDFALINAEVIHKGRKCDVRVINKGLIIKFYKGGKHAGTRYTSDKMG
jgi:hypothetical protein